MNELSSVIRPAQNIKLYESDWNEEDIRRITYDTLCSNNNAVSLTLGQAKALSAHVAQVIIMRFNECRRLAEKI